MPFDRASLAPTIQSPDRANDRQVPMGAVAAVAVTMERVAVLHSDERASPLKPSVETVVRSE